MKFPPGVASRKRSVLVEDDDDEGDLLESRTIAPRPKRIATRANHDSQRSGQLSKWMKAFRDLETGHDGYDHLLCYGSGFYNAEWREEVADLAWQVLRFQQHPDETPLEPWAHLGISATIFDANPSIATDAADQNCAYFELSPSYSALKFNQHILQYLALTCTVCTDGPKGQ
jgi:hypothetical protein